MNILFFKEKPVTGTLEVNYTASYKAMKIMVSILNGPNLKGSLTLVKQCYPIYSLWTCNHKKTPNFL